MNLPLPRTDEEIIERLALPEREFKDDVRYRAFFAEPSRQAAVLIPFLKHKDQTWHLLYTRRTQSVAEHKGQVAFPGGRRQPEDDFPIQTALRETCEEIGIKPQDVRVIGRLDSLHTISNFIVVPVIGIIPWPIPICLQTNEVERVFTVPLEWLADPAHYQIRTRTVVFPADQTPRTMPVIYYEPYQGEVLWGVTAEITHQLLRRLGLIAH